MHGDLLDCLCGVSLICDDELFISFGLVLFCIPFQDGKNAAFVFLASHERRGWRIMVRICTGIWQNVLGSLSIIHC